MYQIVWHKKWSIGGEITLPYFSVGRRVFWWYVLTFLQTALLIVTNKFHFNSWPENGIPKSWILSLFMLVSWCSLALHYRNSSMYNHLAWHYFCCGSMSVSHKQQERSTNSYAIIFLMALANSPGHPHCGIVSILITGLPRQMCLSWDPLSSLLGIKDGTIRKSYEKKKLYKYPWPTPCQWLCISLRMR